MYDSLNSLRDSTQSPCPHCSSRNNYYEHSAAEDLRPNLPNHHGNPEGFLAVEAKMEHDYPLLSQTLRLINGLSHARLLLYGRLMRSQSFFIYTQSDGLRKSRNV